MNWPLNLLCKAGHAIASRAELWRELKRLRRKDGRRIPAAWWDILAQPTRVDDAILIRRFVDPHQRVLVVDVGGNTGQWAEKMLRFVPNTRFIAFEPDCNICIEYRKRVPTECTVSVHNVGLSDEEHSATLHISKDSRHSTLGELTENEELRTVEVLLRRLDSYASEISAARETSDFSILKIDVQGHELSVLRGAKEVLKQFDLIYLECSFVATEGATIRHTFAPACEELLHHEFYPALFRDYGRQFGPYATERDVIFVRSKATLEIIGY